MELFKQAYELILTQDLHQKVAGAFTLYQFALDKGLDEMTGDCPVVDIPLAGLPPSVQLVPRNQLKSRKLTTAKGQASLIHALAHIEFNAINLALDACYRFRGMSANYYLDWLKVAKEEAYHFSMLNQHLNYLGYQYGDFPAQNDLWTMAVKTSYDPLVRMALVPRLLEARGLDVTPGIIERLRAVGDTKASSILEIILQDEVTHVQIGNRWYLSLCKERELDPFLTFKELLQRFAPGYLRAPMARVQRLQAGFSEQELTYFEKLIEEEV